MQCDLDRYWYQPSPRLMNWLLWPLSWLFGLSVFVRRLLYRLHILSTHHFPVPVIVVGNITVGGTGKTPFVIWLARFLREQGYNPGIVTRGAGGKTQQSPRIVHQQDDSQKVGDEALLLVKNSLCPVVVGVNRALAVKHLLAETDCNIVISDDGLQHYRMGRSIEIAMIDGKRRLGNQLLLPAGPLREPVSRLDDVDLVIVKDGNHQDEWSISIAPLHVESLTQPSTVSLASFESKKVHAVAGIGNPDNFFNLLKNADIDIIPHVFPDHYHYQPSDLIFNDDLPVIMTEKDAVKCRGFASEQFWSVAITVEVSDQLQAKLLSMIRAAVIPAKAGIHLSDNSHVEM